MKAKGYCGNVAYFSGGTGGHEWGVFINPASNKVEYDSAIKLFETC